VTQKSFFVLSEINHSVNFPLILYKELLMIGWQYPLTLYEKRDWLLNICHDCEKPFYINKPEPEDLCSKINQEHQFAKIPHLEEAIKHTQQIWGDRKKVSNDELSDLVENLSMRVINQCLTDALFEETFWIQNKIRLISKTLHKKCSRKDSKQLIMLQDHLLRLVVDCNRAIKAKVTREPLLNVLEENTNLKEAIIRAQKIWSNYVSSSNHGYLDQHSSRAINQCLTNALSEEADWIQETISSYENLLQNSVQNALLDIEIDQLQKTKDRLTLLIPHFHRTDHFPGINQSL